MPHATCFRSVEGSLGTHELSDCNFISANCPDRIDLIVVSLSQQSHRCRGDACHLERSLTPDVSAATVAWTIICFLDSRLLQVQCFSVLRMPVQCVHNATVCVRTQGFIHEAAEHGSSQSHYGCIAGARILMSQNRYEQVVREMRRRRMMDGGGERMYSRWKTERMSEVKRRMDGRTHGSVSSE